MPHKSRKVSPFNYYHIIVRGNNKQTRGARKDTKQRDDMSQSGEFSLLRLVPGEE